MLLTGAGALSYAIASKFEQYASCGLEREIANSFTVSSPGESTASENGPRNNRTTLFAIRHSPFIIAIRSFARNAPCQ